MMVSMHNSYINSEAGLMSNISEDVSSFVEPYEDDFEMFRRQKSKGLILEGKFCFQGLVLLIFLIFFKNIMPC